MIIYCAHCIPTGKKYVGLTSSSIKERSRQHFQYLTGDRSTKTRFCKALRKYGKENFIWGVIEECADDDALQREKHFISLLNTHKTGYNSNEGGTGCTHLSDETRAKMSATWKAKGTSNRKGKTNSAESNEKRRQTLIQRYKEKPHHRKGKAPWNKGLRRKDP